MSVFPLKKGFLKGINLQDFHSNHYELLLFIIRITFFHLLPDVYNHLICFSILKQISEKSYTESFVVLFSVRRMKGIHVRHLERFYQAMTSRMTWCTYLTPPTPHLPPRSAINSTLVHVDQITVSGSCASRDHHQLNTHFLLLICSINNSLVYDLSDSWTDGASKNLDDLDCYIKYTALH